MRLRIPHPLRKRRTERDNVTRRLVMDAIHDIRDRPPTIKHVMTVKHDPRPPAPRPVRLAIVWIMQDGQELRQFVSLYGQQSTTEIVPRWVVNQDWNGWPPYTMRFEFQYEDGAPWQR